MLWLLFLLLGIGGIIAVSLGDAGTLGGLDGTAIASLVASICLLMAIGIPLLTHYRGGLSQAAKDLLTWVGIMLALVLAYSFRDDAKTLYQRVAGELMPPGQTLNVSSGEAGLNAVRIRRRADGHFIARAKVNGKDVSLLVDTGASTIVLMSSDATTVGINVSALNFSIPVQTANGTAFAAATQLSSISVGTIAVYNLRVLVARPGALKQSLLGMNFLAKLKSYEFSGDFMTMRG